MNNTIPLVCAQENDFNQDPGALNVPDSIGTRQCIDFFNSIYFPIKYVQCEFRSPKQVNEVALGNYSRRKEI